MIRRGRGGTCCKGGISIFWLGGQLWKDIRQKRQIFEILGMRRKEWFDSSLQVTENIYIFLHFRENIIWRHFWRHSTSLRTEVHRRKVSYSINLFKFYVRKIDLELINSLNTKIATIEKPVNWFALTGFYMMVTLVFSALSGYSLKDKQVQF